MALVQPGVAVVEGDVEHPVQAAFDGPVPADGLTSPFVVEVCRGDAASGFRVQGRAALNAGLDTDDAGSAGQAQVAGGTTLAK